MAAHVELLVEEPSMEAFLRALLPRCLPQHTTFEVHPFQGKDDLLGKLLSRLRGYACWLPEDWRIVVVVDRDDDDCLRLKQRLDDCATQAGLSTRPRSVGPRWQVVNRIAIEELEAWYFGDWEAVHASYPRVASTIPQKRQYRDSDGIAGGTWEAFERIMQRGGYFGGGLRKIEVARMLGAVIEPQRNRSPSFRCFHQAVTQA